MTTTRPARQAPRPESGARTVAACAVGLTALCVFCGAGAFVLGDRAMRRQATRANVRAEKNAVRADESQSCAALLDTIADDLLAHGGDLPETLSEIPRDPWGRQIEYRRTGLDDATLLSTGPDGRKGTADDVVRSVRRR